MASGAPIVEIILDTRQINGKNKFLDIEKIEDNIISNLNYKYMSANKLVSMVNKKYGRNMMIIILIVHINK